MTVRVVAYQTSLGPGWLAFDGETLTMTGLPGMPPPAPPVTAGPGEAALVARLEAYWRADAELPDASPFLALLELTDVQREIYRVVAGVPAGSTTTYSDVAAAAGRPNAPRAVGAAMAANRLAPIVPCHRVLGSKGELTGYAGGLAMKRLLLELERTAGERRDSVPRQRREPKRY